MLDSPNESAADAALALAPHCSVVAVTDGSHGSCIATLGRLLVCPFKHLLCISYFPGTHSLVQPESCYLQHLMLLKAP